MRSPKPAERGLAVLFGYKICITQEQYFFRSKFAQLLFFYGAIWDLNDGVTQRARVPTANNTVSKLEARIIAAMPRQLRTSSRSARFERVPTANRQALRIQFDRNRVC